MQPGYLCPYGNYAMGWKWGSLLQRKKSFLRHRIQSGCDSHPTHTQLVDLATEPIYRDNKHGQERHTRPTSSPLHTCISIPQTKCGRSYSLARYYSTKTTLAMRTCPPCCMQTRQRWFRTDATHRCQLQGEL